MNPKSPPYPKIERPKTVTIIGWLLLLQSLIMFSLGVYHFALNHAAILFSGWFGEFISGQGDSLGKFLNELFLSVSEPSQRVALIESFALFVLTILALSAAYGFLRLWRIAWVQAMLVQGASLLIALILYFQSKPLHIYILMFFGVFMVLYLNYANLQVFFQIRGRSFTEEEEES